MPRFVASDLVLHCTKRTLGFIWVYNMGQICSANENFQNDQIFREFELRTSPPSDMFVF